MSVNMKSGPNSQPYVSRVGKSREETETEWKGTVRFAPRGQPAAQPHGNCTRNQLGQASEDDDSAAPKG